MKNYIKVRQAAGVTLSTFFLLGCSHSGQLARSPSATETNPALNIRVENYEQKLRTIQGQIVPLHFFQSDKGPWYFALGCGPHQSQGHTFEVYSEPLESPDHLQQQLEIARIRDSSEFSSLGECREAFERITAASSQNPVCLKETEEGVLVSQCRSRNRFDDGMRAGGQRF